MVLQSPVNQTPCMELGFAEMDRRSEMLRYAFPFTSQPEAHKPWTLHLCTQAALEP